VQRAAERMGQRSAPAAVESHPNTGPIPVVRPEQFEDADDLDSTPRESALAWLRFAGELIIALAAGVGVYFAATVLWEMAPHVAVLLAPRAVTALVAGVGVWRLNQGREPVGPRLLAILVFAGTLLTIAPAAGLLAGGS
jgi:membrane protein YdbS with pleckstrin-like domain